AARAWPGSTSARATRRKAARGSTPRCSVRGRPLLRLAGLDATAVRVAAVRARRRVAPVALDLPALRTDLHGAGERPRALVGVLLALLVVPRVQLRIGEHLAQLVARHVRERGEALAVAEARRRLGIAAGVTVEVEEEAELDLDPVDRPRAVPRAVAGATA